jgi:hypothetical protein
MLFVVLYNHNKKEGYQKFIDRAKKKNKKWLDLGEETKTALENAARQNNNGRIRVSGIGNEFFYAILAESVRGEQKGSAVAKIEIRPSNKLPITVSTGKESAVLSKLTPDKVSELCEVVRSFGSVQTLR